MTADSKAGQTSQLTSPTASHVHRTRDESTNVIYQYYHMYTRSSMYACMCRYLHLKPASRIQVAQDLPTKYDATKILHDSRHGDVIGQMRPTNVWHDIVCHRSAAIYHIVLRHSNPLHAAVPCVSTFPCPKFVPSMACGESQMLGPDSCNFSHETSVDEKWMMLHFAFSISGRSVAVCQKLD